MSDPTPFEPNKPYRTPSTPEGATMMSGTYSEEEKNWSLIAHLSPLAGYVVPVPFFNIIAPAIVWFLKKETLPMVDNQAKEAINFQITLFLAFLVCFPLVFVFIGIILLPLLIVYGIVMSVLAAKASQEGRLYRYPYTIRLI